MRRLITIPFSHFCEKARWSLDRAGLAYREEGHVPALHRRAVRPVSGGTSVPVLVTGDGTVLAESSLIVQYADARAPASARVLPPAGPERDAALAFERHLDEDLGPHVRRFAYFHLLGDRAAAFRFFDRETPRGELRILRVVFPFVRAAMRRFMNIDSTTALASRDQTRRVFDEVGARLADGRPFLLGDSFSVADLTWASLAAPMLQPKEHPFAPPAVEGMPAPLVAEMTALRETPAGRFGLRLYQEHRGPCRRVPIA